MGEHKHAGQVVYRKKPSPVGLGFPHEYAKKPGLKFRQLAVPRPSSRTADESGACSGAPNTSPRRSAIGP